jgi:hypothetical protein
MKIGDQVIITGRDLTFMGKKFNGWTGEIVGRQHKHGLRLWRVKFGDGPRTELLFMKKNLRIVDDD